MLSARLGVVLHARKIEHYTRLISHNPTIVSGGNRHDVAGSELELAAVVHHNLLVPGENVTEVRGLAAICAGDRLDVLRPTPARLDVALPTTPSPILRISTRPLSAIGRTSSADSKLFF